MTTWVALLLAVAIFPISLLYRYGHGAVARIVAGVVLVALAATAARQPRPLELFGVGMILWGGWMLRTEARREADA